MWASQMGRRFQRQAQSVPICEYIQAFKNSCWGGGGWGGAGKMFDVLNELFCIRR
jgi:hypothetical protein